MKKLFLSFAAVAILSLSALAQPQPPDTLWTRTFGGSDYDYGYSVQQTADGGYIIAGLTRSYGAGSYDVYLVKTDAHGNQQWQQTFGGSNDDKGYSVQQTSDGGYIITGYTRSYGAGSYDVYLVKTDASGNQLWQRTFGGIDWDCGRSVQQTSDSGYIITGDTESYCVEFTDIYLIKTDASGNLQWQRNYGGINIENGSSVQQTADGGYIIAGTTLSYGAGYYDVYLVKDDFSGNLQWQQTFGGRINDIGSSVQQTADGGYIITGYTEPFGAGNYDVFLVKADSSGNQQWQQTFGGSYNDFGNSIQQTGDGGYIIAGWTESYGAGDMDVYLIRLESETLVEHFGDNHNLKFSLSNNYPNPFNFNTTISFQLSAPGVVKLLVYDIQGTEMVRLSEGFFAAGYHNAIFNGSELASGVYFAMLEAGGRKQVRKMLLIK